MMRKNKNLIIKNKGEKMKKVYFVDIKGKLSEFTIIEREGMSPASGCDFLIEDEKGFIYSGSYKSYFATKKEALQEAEKRFLKWAAQSEERLFKEKLALEYVQIQLLDLQSKGEL